MCARPSNFITDALASTPPCTQVQLWATPGGHIAICTYAEALFPAPYLIGLLLKFGAPSPAGATPTPPAPGCPSHGPSPHGTNLTQRGSQ